MDPRHEPETIDVDREHGVSLNFRDGYEARFELAELRRACPCAACRGLRERGEAAWPRADSPMPLSVHDASLHGAWGLAVEWNDGHGTGIYPFESLRRWAEHGVALTPDSGFGA